ncbi:MAG: SPOR domain-containing protein [Bacteroidetes bacterium]|nr:SPOR domain-containing protein [Bacteroidota bacterium]
MSLILLFFYFFISDSLLGQEVQNLYGNIELIQDSRIDSLVTRHVLYNQNNQFLIGYRIQIFFDAGNNSLQNAYKAAEIFFTKYPDENAYVTFKEPYYRVRVGDFRTRLEAEGFRQMIILDYPNAFLIRDNINPAEIR